MEQYSELPVDAARVLITKTVVNYLSLFLILITNELLYVSYMTLHAYRHA